MKTEPDYQRIADSLVERAKICNLLPGEKLDVHLEDLCSLLHLKTAITKLNNPHLRGDFIHEVKYQGFIFVSYSPEKIVPFINGEKR